MAICELLDVTDNDPRADPGPALERRDQARGARGGHDLPARVGGEQGARRATPPSRRSTRSPSWRWCERGRGRRPRLAAAAAATRLRRHARCEPERPLARGRGAARGAWASCALAREGGAVAPGRGRVAGAARRERSSLSLTQPNIARPRAPSARPLRAALERAGALRGGAGGSRAARSRGARGARAGGRAARRAAGRARRDGALPAAARRCPSTCEDARVAGRAPRGGRRAARGGGDLRGRSSKATRRACRASASSPGSWSSAGLALADARGARAAATAPARELGPRLRLAGRPARTAGRILVRTLPGDFTASADAVAREAANTLALLPRAAGGHGPRERVPLRARRSLPAEDARGARCASPSGSCPRSLDPWAALGRRETGARGAGPGRGRGGPACGGEAA